MQKYQDENLKQFPFQHLYNAAQGTVRHQYFMRFFEVVGKYEKIWIVADLKEVLRMGRACGEQLAEYK